MADRFAHLGEFSGLVNVVGDNGPLFPVAHPGPETRKRVQDVLAFAEPNSAPGDIRVLNRWERDEVTGEAISWSVGYGPRPVSWVLKPTSIDGPLPGIVALHGHDGFKYFGKEKIADGPNGAEPGVVDLQAELYEGRAFANELARRGFIVLVPDAFLWGSRRFPLDIMPEHIRKLGEASEGTRIQQYNAAARFHEDLVARYCAVLGTTLAGIVSAEDRVAVRYLQSRSDVQAEHIGCIGLSGGGARAALLQATCDDIQAAVVVGMMSTYQALLDHSVASHTWMFFPNGWSRYGDWPDLAACRAPSPLLVQYLRNDHLFPPDGMRAADECIVRHYASVGYASGYEGQFFDGPHRFDREMHGLAFEWLGRRLSM